MAISATLILAATFFVLAIPLVLRVFNRQAGKLQLPPGPRGLPLIGYLPFLGQNLHQLLMELAQTYGPIYKISIGQQLCVIVSAPSLVKEILRDKDIIFANRNPTVAPRTFSYGCNDIAFASFGPEWRLLRKILMQQMQSSTNVEAFYSLRRREIRRSVDNVIGKVGEGINFGEMTYLTVLNMISGMFWGDTLEEGDIDIGLKFRAAVFELLEILGKPNVSDFFPFLERFDIQGVEKEMKMLSERIDKIFDHVIDKRIEKNKSVKKEKNSERKDFMQFLLEFKDKDTGRSMLGWN